MTWERASDITIRLVFSVWLVKLLVERIYTLARLPAEAFDPVGVLSFLNPSEQAVLLAPEFLFGLMLVGVACCVAALAGVRSIPLYVVAAVCFTTYGGIARGFGHCNHADVGMLLLVYMLCLLAISDKLSGHRRDDLRVTGAIGLICLSYFLTGAFRCYTGGVEAFTTDSLSKWAVEDSFRASYFHLRLGDDFARNWWLAWSLRIGFVVVTIGELAAPICLIWPRFVWPFLALMVPFHILVLLSMDILFWESLVALCVLFPVYARCAK